jgi:F0F1-type ATP synthase assembly protein I
MAGAEPSPRPSLPVGLIAVGSQMVGFTVIGVLLDLYVFRSMPAFTIGLTVLGFIAAFVQLIRYTKTRFGPNVSRPPDKGPR